MDTAWYGYSGIMLSSFLAKMKVEISHPTLNIHSRSAFMFNRTDTVFSTCEVHGT